MVHSISMHSDSSGFVFPLRDLESERVKLTPFVGSGSGLPLPQPTLHAIEFVERINAHPQLFKFLPYGPFDSVEGFTNKFYEERIHKDEGSVLFAILDKTAGSLRLAGLIGLLNTSVANQSTEMGHIIIFPEFQRTHVASNAVGLLLYYCLELPDVGASNLTERGSDGVSKFHYGPGLGLRRVQWQAYQENTPSVRTAERMGFRREGILRWQRIVPEGKFGSRVPPSRGALSANPGRHTWIGAVCWDDWELEGARELVEKQIRRL